MVSSGGFLIVLLIVIALNYPCHAFQLGRQFGSVRLPNACQLCAIDDGQVQCTKPSLDPEIAAQFTIKVCTSTSCTRKLKEEGLDQYHALGEVYAQAQSANLEESMIIEDGGCQGGRNCKMGPCVAILHEDFEGNVALEGMNSNEFRERVFHNIMTGNDAERVWSCMENAIVLMADEANASSSTDSEPDIS
mmetsp:Transcript_35973/g.86837  ORF Transcript_35973/g.86837 Transcript_35973/m.86837 type:complete len:191 (-) Transcript_35973:204-776(-)|eukprot:CAMPEP_0181075870 /NCGR_PEP_ID=MMETSP1071-20121207/116_1 /TAXON_ID=35127 /ORGANISM="Thalassiosira sp., Strain NH16" /LENGTH=190 /DNA_ID=CAMNT_0023157013 /DNA_START=117 /DNA_END=689 /DNA_ORIENTATION=-